MPYLAKLERDGDGFLLTFPKVPEAITGGTTRDEAVANAPEALELALRTYAAEGRDLPTEDRRPVRAGEVRVVVSATVAAKLSFIRAFRESGMTRVGFGAKLGKAESEVRRMLDPYHQTKLGAIEAGLRALGKRLVLTVEEAA